MERPKVAPLRRAVNLEASPTPVSLGERHASLPAAPQAQDTAAEFKGHAPWSPAAPPLSRSPSELGAGPTVAAADKWRQLHPSANDGSAKRGPRIGWDLKGRKS